MPGKKRRMAGTKEAVVLRLLRGEDMELVSRESGFGLHELKKWLDQYRKLWGRHTQLQNVCCCCRRWLPRCVR